MIARRTARHLVSTAVALTLGAPAAALGQEVGPYDPLGIRAGSFLIFPQLTVSEAYDTNVFAVPNNTDDDFITLVQPRVTAQSNFSRHSLNLTAGGNIAFYANNSDENYQDAFIQSNGRLDVTHANYFTGALNLARAHEGRDDPENNPNQSLKELYQYGGSLGFTQLFNRLNFSLTGNVAAQRLCREQRLRSRPEQLYRGTAHRLLHLAPDQHLRLRQLQRHQSRSEGRLRWHRARHQGVGCGRRRRGRADRPDYQQIPGRLYPAELRRGQLQRQ